MNFLTENFDVKTASTDQLSFVGDAVYSLLVREFLVNTGKCRSNELHKSSAELVNAAAQASAFCIIEEMLDETEIAVYKRGRNAHNNHKPKNAQGSDYNSATGVEALFGYLYLSGKTERIAQLFSIIIGLGDK